MDDHRAAADFLTAIPAFCLVISALYPVIPAKAGIHKGLRLVGIGIYWIIGISGFSRRVSSTGGRAAPPFSSLFDAFDCMLGIPFDSAFRFFIPLSGKLAKEVIEL